MRLIQKRIEEVPHEEVRDEITVAYVEGSSLPVTVAVTRVNMLDDDGPETSTSYDAWTLDEAEWIHKALGRVLDDAGRG